MPAFVFGRKKMYLTNASEIPEAFFVSRTLHIDWEEA